jgi:hypoxanthine phosphoribosyltransferase
MSDYDKRVPTHFNPLFSAEEIRTQVQSVAQSITPWVKDVAHQTQKAPLAVCILRGGIFFYADLVRHIPVSLELAFCRCQSYSSEMNRQSEAVVCDFMSTHVKNRHVLLIDDICDTADTLNLMIKKCLNEGALQVKTAVALLRKRTPAPFTPDWHCFTFERDNWIVGYGMEDKNTWANAPEMYSLS